MICPKCGSENAAGATFCGLCYERFPTTSQDSRQTREPAFAYDLPPAARRTYVNLGPMKWAGALALFVLLFVVTIVWVQPAYMRGKVMEPYRTHAFVLPARADEVHRAEGPGFVERAYVFSDVYAAEVIWNELTNRLPSGWVKTSAGITSWRVRSEWNLNLANEQSLIEEGVPGLADMRERLVFEMHFLTDVPALRKTPDFRKNISTPLPEDALDSMDADGFEADMPAEDEDDGSDADSDVTAARNAIVRAYGEDVAERLLRGEGLLYIRVEGNVHEKVAFLEPR